MRESDCLLLIGNLEKGLVEYYYKKKRNTFIKPKITTHETIDSIVGTTRRPASDGYYLFTIDEGKESHGITIIKKTHETSGEIRFFLFDPNGRSWANCKADIPPCTLETDGAPAGYNIKVSYAGKIYRLDKSLTPIRSLNPMGECSLWNLIMLVLFQEQPQDVNYFLNKWSERLGNTHNKIYRNNKAYNKGHMFMFEIYNAITNKAIYNMPMDYNSSADVQKFIDLCKKFFNLFKNPSSLVYPEPPNPSCGNKKQFPPSCRLFMLDDYILHELIEQRAFTKEILREYSKNELILLCEFMGFAGCAALARNKKDIIDFLIETQQEFIDKDRADKVIYDTLLNKFNTNKFTKHYLSGLKKEQHIIIFGFYEFPAYLANRMNTDDRIRTILELQKTNKR